MHCQGSVQLLLNKHAAHLHCFSRSITARAAAQAPSTATISVSKGDRLATGSRRQMLAISCACCYNLLLPGLQLPAEANQGLFSYDGELGPQHWAGTCSAGTQQSPVNLPSNSKHKCSQLPAPTFQYQETNSARVKNTGATIQVNMPPGNIVQWGDQQLELLQYHFHTPSEHAFDGQRAALEAHLVHRNKSTGELGVLAVLMQPPAVLSRFMSSLNNTYPTTANNSLVNPCLAAALSYVPSISQKEAACPSSINPLQLLPADAASKVYVHYRGSLTTPPCSEGVDWFVYKDILPVDQQQVKAFMQFVGAGSSHGHNARPLQPLNGRILEPSCLSVA